jgi:hypothetical protein
LDGATTFVVGIFFAWRTVFRPPHWIREDLQVQDALELLAERYESAEHDGAIAYAAFLDGGDGDLEARHRQEAVAVVRQFLTAT